MNDRVAPVAPAMVCAGCGATAADVGRVRIQPDRGIGADAYPFRCSHARENDDTDHVLTRVLDPAMVRFPGRGDANPFVAYRNLFHSYHVAHAHGMSDDDYVGLVRALDDEVARVDGHGFRVTPFARHAALSARLGSAPEGGVWIKDETASVSGSHKGRHVMGIAIYLRVLSALGMEAVPSPTLAIASCGNAALAAAVVARAARRTLDVFVPPDAPPEVVRRLEQLGAHLVVCPRDPGIKGDPCYLGFRAAVAGGALPFCCQGPANGLTIEGAETIGYEMVTALDGAALDHVVIQVGGGALASAVIQSFGDAMALGACTRLPRFHAVQTGGAFPLKRAYDRLFDCILSALASEGSTSDGDGVDLIARRFTTPAVQRELRYAATHRRSFMWPWDAEPRSIARGILDDETYDWLAIVTGMLRTGGRPVVVDEATLVEAHTLARETTGIDVDHTGAAGLAGLLQLGREGAVAPRENVAVIFSGAQRGA
jgi:threonine dehydratase